MSEVSKAPVLSKEVDQSSIFNQQNELPAEQIHALEILDREKFIRIDPEGRVQFDLEKFKSKSPYSGYQRHLNKEMGSLPGLPNERKNGWPWPITVYSALKGVKGYSFEDYQKLQRGEDIKPKPLIYSPDTANDVFDIQKIAESEFYLGLWEIGEVPILPATYPTLKEGLGSDVSTQEAIIALLLYHPQYGNAVRGNGGQLEVTYGPNVKGRYPIEPFTRSKINNKFFYSWGYNGAPGTVSTDKNSLNGSAAKFLLRNCPSLIERDLIRPFQDFKVVANRSELGFAPRQIRKNGLVMIDGRQYSLGREYGRPGEYIAFQVSNNHAVILDLRQKEKPEVVKIFKLEKAALSGDELRRPASSRKIVSKSEIEVIDPDRIEGIVETDRKLITGFKDLLAFSQKTFQEGQFTLFDLTFKEKSLAISIYQEYQNNPRLWGFLRRYGITGLRSLLATEETRHNCEEVFEIGEKMPAEGVFSDVSDIVNTVTTYQDSIRQNLSEEDQRLADEVSHTIMGFTSNLLLSLTPIVQGDPRLRGKMTLNDVVSTLGSFKESVFHMYEKKYGMRNTNSMYQKILDVYKGESNNPNVDQVALKILSNLWRDQASVGQDQVSRVYDATFNFYNQNQELFTSASETTGDTKREIERFKDYLQQFLIRRELEGRKGELRVLDMGCGEGRRITEPMAQMLAGKGEVLGIDLHEYSSWHEGEFPENITFRKGSFADIPLSDNSISLATAHWSVFNDLTSRRLQLDSLSELSRVLQIGGEFYFDVPYLEGGEGSWEQAAKEYHKMHPDQPYGMIYAQFPEGRSKEFDIYPEKELNALLDHGGFIILDSNIWRTEAGRPRRTIVARLDRKVTLQKIAA